MPKEDNEILKYIHGRKSPFIIYTDTDSLLEKNNTCHNNFKKSSTTNINKYTPSGYSLFKHCSFDPTKDLRYKTPKKFPVVFHNCSTYDYHFIMKELAEESEGQFECLGKNT